MAHPVRVAILAVLFVCHLRAKAWLKRWQHVALVRIGDLIQGLPHREAHAIIQLHLQRYTVILARTPNRYLPLIQEQLTGDTLLGLQEQTQFEALGVDTSGFEVIFHQGEPEHDEQ